MAYLNFKFSMTDKLKKLFDGTKSRDMKSMLRDRMQKVALLMEREVKEQLSMGPKDMPAYKGKAKVRIEHLRLPKNPTVHLRVRTGRLRQSVKGRVENRHGQIVAIIGPQRVVYAPVHEFGYPARRIPARPYLRPAIKNKREEVIGILKDGVKEVFV